MASPTMHLTVVIIQLETTQHVLTCTHFLYPAGEFAGQTRQTSNAEAEPGGYAHGCSKVLSITRV